MPKIPTLKHIKLIFTIAAMMLALSTSVSAQERSGLGVGVETLLTSEFSSLGATGFPGVATLTYDSGSYYASGMLSFINIDNTATLVVLGGRFYYPIHDGDNSDFSLGGGFALLNTDLDGAPESDTSFHLEAGGRIRAWLNSNVALNAGVGLAILVADSGGGPPNNNAVGLVGNLFGSVGVSYFFW